MASTSCQRTPFCVLIVLTPSRRIVEARLSIMLKDYDSVNGNSVVSIESRADDETGEGPGGGLPRYRASAGGRSGRVRVCWRAVESVARMWRRRMPGRTPDAS